MSFRNRNQSTEQRDAADRSTTNHSPTRQSAATRNGASKPSAMGRTWGDIDRAEAHFGMQIPDIDTLQRLQHHEQKYGRKTHEWIAEGMPVDIIGKSRDMKAFRQRQADRPPEVPKTIERQNRRSVLRSEKAAGETEPAGETGVPEPVRDVLSSRGQSLDGSIQRAMEDRMGDPFGDVRIHTGPSAAEACESINARAFTVGNHIAFNSGEYDPESPEGQHVLAHELAHVRQQTEGAVSMLPQEEFELEVDPDPALEREAEEAAQQVMESGELGIQRMADTDVHIQRAGLGSHVSQDRTWSPGRGPDQPQQPAQPDSKPVDIEVDEIEADPEKLAQEVQEIKQRQVTMMQTVVEGSTTSSGEPSADLFGAALKGPAGSAVSGVAEKFGEYGGASVGATIGSTALPVVGTVGGAVVGGALGYAGGKIAGGAAGDMAKEGVDYALDKSRQSENEGLRSRLRELEQELAELRDGSGTNEGESTGDAQSRR